MLNGLMVAALICGVFALWYSRGVIVKPLTFPVSVIDVIAGLDALSNLSILLFVSLFFGGRYLREQKSKKCLSKLHHLREFIHILDMHQAAKELKAVGLSDSELETELDHKYRNLRAQEYMGVVNDLIVLAGKSAAIYPRLNDADTVIATAHGIEELSLGMSSKLWQRFDRLQRT